MKSHPSRKALRKLTRDEKKKRKVGKLRRVVPTSDAQVEERQPLKKVKREISTSLLKSFMNPDIAAEEREIARLDKLMGLDTKKDRKKAAAKLNKEYGMFEGMGDDFGDFLMDLDDLADIAQGKKSRRSSVFADESGRNEDDQVEEHQNIKGHILDDDEQEHSDIDDDVRGDDEEDNDEDDVDDDDDNDDSAGDINDENKVDGDDESSDMAEDVASSEGDEEDDDEKEDDEDEDEQKAGHVYRPAEGEDIYGRQKSSGGKYVPPAKRALMPIDESSDSVKMVRRQMNGLMNRLSDQTKDSILKSIKSLFDSNSATVVSHVLRDCIMCACANSTQLMTSLIPAYASIVAALHLIVGVDVGAFIIESVANKLHLSIQEARSSSSSQKRGISALVADKLPNNCVVLLAYFYNLRILHHQLIVDIMEVLASGTDRIGELEADLLVCLIDHCGTQLRGDDPTGLRSIINSLSAKAGAGSGSERDEEGSRLKFLLESFTDLKNNKSRRNQSANSESVKKLRRWLGTIKTMFTCKSGDLSLRVSLHDLLDAEKHGRWWRAGASWLGNQASAPEAGVDVKPRDDDSSAVVSEEQQLLLLAAKMKFNTNARKSIFVVVMSSRDVNDAFERLGKLDLKGKEDREIIRVLVECCGQEKKYNAFYAELAALLCDRNHQYKMTLQYCFWDAFKDMSDGRFSNRRTMNLAHFLSRIVTSFHLPLSVIKPIECTSSMADCVVLFLSTFFLAIFSSKVSDATFVSIFDRVATTKDYATVRELVLTFLQTHFRSIPSGLDPDKSKGVEKRRLKTIKLMNDLRVLDYRHE